MSDALLNVKDVDLGYGTLKVVHQVSLHVGRGELVGLVGGNGSGKSTILRAISGMIKPWSGIVTFAGEAVRNVRPHAMARRGLAHVPMGRQLFANMTVSENLMLGAFLPAAKAQREDNLALVKQLFPDLASHTDTRAGNLSGGQQQMVAIARALMLDPKMLIMDEPSHGLSPFMVKDTMAAIRRVVDAGLPVLLVEQNVKQVLSVADRTYVLENGKVVLDGTSEQLHDDPRIRKAYLGL